MYFRSLQAARGIAALLVVLFHLGGAFAAEKYFGTPVFDNLFYWAGEFGVHFFFVLSGFIIFTAHEKDLSKPSRAKAYVFKRLIRIYPTYWIILGAVVLVSMASPAWREGLPQEASVITATICLLPQDSQVVGGTGAPILPVAWSLQYEVFFYFVFFTLIINKWSAAIWGIVVLTIAATSASSSFPYSFILSSVTVLFAFGMLVAKVRDCSFAFSATLFASLAILLAIIGSRVGLDEEANAWVSRSWSGLGFASSLWLSVRLEGRKRLHFNEPPRLLLLIGDASYAMYLIHYPLISVLCKLFIKVGFANGGIAVVIAAFALCLVVIVICSCCFHVAIERPIIRFLKHFNKASAVSSS